MYYPYSLVSKYLVEKHHCLLCYGTNYVRQPQVHSHTTARSFPLFHHLLEVKDSSFLSVVGLWTKDLPPWAVQTGSVISQVIGGSPGVKCGNMSQEDGRPPPSG